MKAAKTPPASSTAARNRMKATRGKDNAYELALRRALHARGLRFRLHRKVIPGTTRTADIVFFRQRVAVFVDGCFWHGCPIHGTAAKANAEWWAAKIQANKQRDRDTNARLGDLGWAVLRIWEHEELGAAVEKVAALLRARGR